MYVTNYVIIFGEFSLVYLVEDFDYRIFSDYSRELVD